MKKYNPNLRILSECSEYYSDGRFRIPRIPLKVGRGLRYSDAGFTLLEAMIAIFLITVGIVAVLQLFPVSIQQQEMAKRRTVASQLAQEKIEEIFSKTYDEVLNEATTTLSPPFDAYSRKVEVTYFDPNTSLATSSDTGIKKIEVIIYWESPLGVTEKNFKITTLISKR